MEFSHQPSQSSEPFKVSAWLTKASPLQPLLESAARFWSCCLQYNLSAYTASLPPSHPLSSSGYSLMPSSAYIISSSTTTPSSKPSRPTLPAPGSCGTKPKAGRVWEASFSASQASNVYSQTWEPSVDERYSYRGFV